MGYDAWPVDYIVAVMLLPTTVFTLHPHMCRAVRRALQKGLHVDPYWQNTRLRGPAGPVAGQEEKELEGEQQEELEGEQHGEEAMQGEEHAVGQQQNDDPWAGDRSSSCNGSSSSGSSSKMPPPDMLRQAAAATAAATGLSEDRVAGIMEM